MHGGLGHGLGAGARGAHGVVLDDVGARRRHRLLQHGAALVALDAQVLARALLAHDDVDVARDHLQDLLRLRRLHRVVLVAATTRAPVTTCPTVRPVRLDTMPTFKLVIGPFQCTDIPDIMTARTETA